MIRVKYKHSTAWQACMVLLVDFHVFVPKRVWRHLLFFTSVQNFRSRAIIRAESYRYLIWWGTGEGERGQGRRGRREVKGSMHRVVGLAWTTCMQRRSSTRLRTENTGLFLLGSFRELISAKAYSLIHNSHYKKKMTVENDLKLDQEKQFIYWLSPNIMVSTIN